jgi:two-component system, cell cycle sensor histidine kinase and response regulator CckA
VFAKLSALDTGKQTDMREDFQSHKGFTEELAELRGRIAELESWRTEHRWMAEALKQSEAKFRNLTERAMVGVYLIQDNVFTYVNPRMTAIFGYHADELVQEMSAQDLVLPDDWPAIQHNFVKDASAEADSFNCQFRAVRRDREVIHVEVYGSTMTYNHKSTVIGTVLDITQRMHAEASLAKELAKFQALYCLATAMTADRTLDENLSLVVETSRSLLNADTSYIALRDDKANHVYMHTLSGIKTQAFKNLSIPVGVGLGGRVAASCRGCIVEDYFQEIEPALHEVVRAEGLISGVAVPVEMGQRNLGVLYIFNRTKTVFAQSDLDTLGLLGKLAAIEITRKGTELELLHAREELEQRVAERTRELSEINTQLQLEMIQRTAIEEQLLQSEERYRSLVEESFDGILVHKNGEIVFANSRLYHMLNYHNGSLEGQHIWSICHPDDRGLARKLALAPMRGERCPSQYEISLQRGKGGFFPVEINTRVIESRNGKAILLWIRDITARKTAEDALKKSEEKYRLVVENASDAICVAQDGMLKFVNPRCKTITGYSERELLSMPFSALVHGEDREMLLELHEKTVKARTLSGTHAFRIHDKERNMRWVEANAVLIDWGGRPATLNFIADVTAKRKMETELLKVEKLESIGILAGGIAHDFNNIVTAILGNISIARMYLPTKDKVFERLTEAEKACLHAQSLTQQLLTFSKGGAPIKKLAFISGMIRDACQFALRGSNVRCDFDFQENLWAVEVDGGQINQVIYNLVINAQHAMPNGGIIDVSAQNAAVSVEDGLPLGSGHYVRITVRDYGVGIPKSIVAKIFDPYFTTKNRGSGLGLATSFSIVKNHGGLITVDSEEGVGTAFHVFLPASRHMRLPQEQRDDRLLKGRGRVLLMDDEPFIRDLAGEMLSLLGYEVILASDGSEALALYRAALHSSRPVDAVIMDLTVPGGMGGSETIQRLREIDPAVKAIVSSGYSNDPIMADYERYGFRGVVAKPYSIQELSETLTRVVCKELR